MQLPKNTKVSKFIPAIIVIALFAFVPASAKATAVTGAVSSGLGCAAGYAIGQALAIINVPTNSGIISGKECLLDGIGLGIAKSIISSYTDSVVDWINSGFEGNPLYSTNFQDDLRNTADKAGGLFLQGLTGGRGNPIYDALCFPGKIGINLPLPTAEPFELKAECSLTRIEGNIDMYTSFKNNGWPAWLELTHDKNNPYGLTLMAFDEYSNQRTAAAEEKKFDWQLGDGIESLKECVEYHYQTDPNCDPETTACNSVPTCIKWKNITPGKAIENQLADVMGSSVRSLEMADEFDEVIGALIDQAFNTLAGGLFNRTTSSAVETAAATEEALSDPESAISKAKSARDRISDIKKITYSWDAGRTLATLKCDTATGKLIDTQGRATSAGNDILKKFSCSRGNVLYTVSGSATGSKVEPMSKTYVILTYDSSGTIYVNTDSEKTILDRIYDSLSKAYDAVRSNTSTFSITVTGGSGGGGGSSSAGTSASGGSGGSGGSATVEQGVTCTITSGSQTLSGAAVEDHLNTDRSTISTRVSTINSYYDSGGGYDALIASLDLFDSQASSITNSEQLGYLDELWPLTEQFVPSEDDVISALETLATTAITDELAYVSQYASCTVAGGAETPDAPYVSLGFTYSMCSSDSRITESVHDGYYWSERECKKYLIMNDRGLSADTIASVCQLALGSEHERDPGYGCGYTSSGQINSCLDQLYSNPGLGRCPGGTAY